MTTATLALTSARTIAWDRGEGARLYLAHASWLSRLLACWWILVWVVPVLATDATVGAAGYLVAAIVATRVGGSEVADGSESALYAMPCPPRRRYWLRAGIVLGFVTCWCGSASFASDHALPEALWGLLLPHSGLAQVPEGSGSAWHALPNQVGYAALTFALAIGASAPGLARSAWVLAGLVLTVGVVMRECLAYQLDVDRGTCDPWVGSVLGAIALVIGAERYVRKEPLDRPASTPSTGVWWWVAVLTLLMAMLFLGLMTRG